MRFLRYLLVLTLVTLAIWRLLPRFKDFSDFVEIGKNINYFYLVAAICSQIGQYIGDGWLSQLILKIIDFKMKLKDTIRIASLNVFAAHLLPVSEFGTIAATFYFYRKLGVNNQSIIFLSLAWGIITNLVLLTMFISSILLLRRAPNLPISARTTASIFAILILLVILSLVFLKLFWSKIRLYLARYSWFSAVLSFRKNIGLYKKAILSHKTLVFFCALAALIYYASNIATLTFSFLSFGNVPSLSIITVAYTLSLVAGWLTLSPAGIGATEATLILIFLQFNVDPAQTLGSVLTFRLISFWLPIPTGLLAYLSLKKSAARV